MPAGKVKFYDAERGFGFISKDDGGDVYVRSAALPEGVTELKPGQRVEFGVADSRRGEQALAVRVLDKRPSVVEARRKRPEVMAEMMETLIKYLDGLSSAYHHGRHPAPADARKAAAMLRKIADEIEV